MSKRLFVGGLAWATDDTSLRQAFEAHGEVTDARVITDRETGRSRGFGFVTFATEEEAQAALDALNGAELDGRALRIDLARERQGGGGGGGGGFRGGGGGGGGGYRGGGGGGGRGGWD
jgi:cold-inducible RNA-binding protein